MYKTAACVHFFNFLVRLLFKFGFYLRLACMQGSESDILNDWLTDSMTHRLFRWLNDWLEDWPTDSKTDQLTRRLANYCIAGNFRQQKISSRATNRQLVRNLYSSNIGHCSFARRLFARHSFAYSLFSHSWMVLIPHFWFVKKNLVRN